MKYIIRAIYGMIVGVANIIPGVSGGTIAVILNIYDRLIGSVTNLRKQFKESMLFLIPFGIGAGAGIFLFSKLLSYLLENFPMPTNFFFIGLIIGGIPMVYKKATETKFKPLSIIPFVIALCGILALTIFGGSSETAADTTANSAITLNFGYVLYLIFGGAISAVSMLIPGVSGSMVMMIIGLYTSVLGAISRLDILFLLPVAVGIIIGVFGGAKLIEICLKKAPQATFFAIIGLMVGSLYAVWCNAGVAFNIQLVFAVIALAAGFAVSFIFGRERKSNK
ncbi:MAG: DUF368 domain-containing protein [Acutalibacteraceae bacterium]